MGLFGAKKENLDGAVCPLCDGLTVVSKEEKHLLSKKVLYAFGNSEGEPISDFIYQTIYMRGDGRIIAGIPAKGVNTKQAICDRGGKPLTGFYDSIKDFTDGYALVTDNGYFGLIDESCKVIVAPNKYRYLAMPRFGYIVFASHFTTLFPAQGAFGVMDLNGRILIPEKYAHLVIRSENVFEVGSLMEKREIAGLTKDKITYKPVFGLVDKNNNKLSETRFLELGAFSKGLAPAKVFDNKNRQTLGYVNENYEMNLIAEQEAYAEINMVATINNLSPFENGRGVYTDVFGKTKVLEKR